MDLKGSKTEASLLTAFNLESQSRNRYSYYAHSAMHEGYRQLSDFLEHTADNKKAHSKIFHKIINGPIPNIRTNLENILKESYEKGSLIYPEFAELAREEGFDEIAYYFEEIAKIELGYVEEYSNILKSFKNGTNKGEKDWICSACGYEHTGFVPPEYCPLCKNFKNHFSLKAICFDNSQVNTSIH